MKRYSTDQTELMKNIILSAVILISFLSVISSEDKSTYTPDKKENHPKGHLEPLGNSGYQVNIPIHDGFMEPRRFYEEHVLKARPIIFKGAALNIPAYKLWTDDYLRSIAPNGTEGNVSVETTFYEQQPQKTKILHMRQFLDEYKNNSYYSIEDIGDYLKQDLTLPWSIQCSDYEKIIKGAVMWLSNGGTQSKLHVDTYENINCLFRGRKNFLLIDTHKYFHIESTILDEYSYSHLNVDAVDLVKYPALIDIEFQVANLEAGDCIYVPQIFMHQVKSFGNNLAVNLWWQGGKLMPPIDTSKCSSSFDFTKTLDKFNISFKPSFYGEYDEITQVGYMAEMARLKFIYQIVDPPRHSFSFSQTELTDRLLNIYGDRENFRQAFKLLFTHIDTTGDNLFTELDVLGKDTNNANATWVKFFEAFDILARRYDVNFILSEPLVELPVAGSDIIKILENSLENVRTMYGQQDKDEL